MTQRLLRLGLAVLCTGLVAVVATEISVGAFSVAVPSIPETRTAARVEMPPLPDIDAMVSEILGRPLFSSSRLPYEEVAEAEEDEGEGEPQQLQSRLTGVAIRPEGREALFERDGGKPVAVKEGGQIDGWTVKSIRTDQVLLSNTLGDEVLKPAFAPARVRRPPQRVAATNGAAAQTGQNTEAAANGAPTIRSPKAASGSRQGQK
jgi:hypothetical protein